MTDSIDHDILPRRPRGRLLVDAVDAFAVLGVHHITVLIELVKPVPLGVVSHQQPGERKLVVAEGFGRADLELVVAGDMDREASALVAGVIVWV